VGALILHSPDTLTDDSGEWGAVQELSSHAPDFTCDITEIDR